MSYAGRLIVLNKAEDIVRASHDVSVLGISTLMEVDRFEAGTHPDGIGSIPAGSRWPVADA